MTQTGKPKPAVGSRLKFKTINAQLSFYYSMLITVVIVSILIFVSILVYNQFAEQKKDIMQSTLETVAGSVESRISALRRMTQSLRNEDSIKNAYINKTLSVRAYDYINQTYVYGLQSVLLISRENELLNSGGISNVGQMLESTDYYKFLVSKREEMFSAPHSFPFETRSDDPDYNNRLSYFFALRDWVTYEIYGYVQLNIARDSLFTDRDKLMKAQFNQLYVINGNGDILFSSGGYDANSEEAVYAVSIAKNNTSALNVTNGGNIYFHFPVETYPDWHIIGVNSISFMNQSSDLFMISVLTIGILSIIFCVIISMVISRRISIPIKRLGNSMAIFESGEIPQKTEVNPAAGEVEALVHGFNSMLDNIQANIDEIYREQEEKKRAEIVALEYQLESLQRQINPHFLYNTLNVISYLAMEDRSEEIRSFVQSFNHLLRSTLSNTQDEVTVKQETAFLKDYAHIMEYRYKDKFTLALDIDPEAFECMIPKLIFQPLVENSLLHGIMPLSHKGSICVSVKLHGDELTVAVKDDGVGFDPKNMDALIENPKGFNSIGLKNVNDRLVICYGQNAALKFLSPETGGATVMFSVPVKYEEL